MEWLLDNLKLIVFVVIILIYAMKAMKAKSEAEGGDSGQPTRRTMPGEQDAAEAERTRQIQEEIRRRILARQRGETVAPPPQETTQPEPEPEQVEGPQTLRPVVVAERAREEDPYAREAAERAAREASLLETQRAFEEQLRQIRAAREAATAAVPRLSVAVAPMASSRRASAVRGSWRAELAGRESLRRAVVLREILGDPVGLRRGPAGSTHR